METEGDCCRRRGLLVFKYLVSLTRFVKREPNVTATVDNMLELPQEVAAQKHG